MSTLASISRLLRQYRRQLWDGDGFVALHLEACRATAELRKEIPCTSCADPCRSRSTRHAELVRMRRKVDASQTTRNQWVCMSMAEFGLGPFDLRFNYFSPTHSSLQSRLLFNSPPSSSLRSILTAERTSSSLLSPMEKIAESSCTLVLDELALAPKSTLTGLPYASTRR